MVDSEISNGSRSPDRSPSAQGDPLRAPARDWGHTCTNRAWALAKGDYCYRLDDDNYFLDDGSLERINRSHRRLGHLPHHPHDGFETRATGGSSTTHPACGERIAAASWSVATAPAGPPCPATTTQTASSWSTCSRARSHIRRGQDDAPLTVMPTTSITVKRIATRTTLVSIFTACHDITYLREAYESIKDQDFHEWVVAYNNGGTPLDFGDPRVKSHVLYRAPGKVGTLKAYCCQQATGDILLELDCDDMLLPTAIAEVKAAFADPTVGFVYSNCIHAMADLSPYPRFDESFGWRYRPVTFQGHKLDEYVSFPPTPESISRVWYGPDHLRAFRRSVYQKVGGHDRTLRVLDDSDLVIRMYLETTLPPHRQATLPLSCPRPEQLAGPQQGDPRRRLAALRPPHRGHREALVRR